MTRVIKVGGRAQEDPQLASALAAACAAAPGAVCIVHGGGGTVSALQRAMGAEPAFIGGRRVTTAADVELVRMALSGAANKQLVARLITAGINAVGISGEDGALIGARAAAAAILGRVGAPETVNAALLHHLIRGGYVPVISPVARDVSHADGAPLNVNGDDAAAMIAAVLGADELLFVSDVAGVIVRGEQVAELAAADAMRAIADGTANGGMVAKLEAAARALAGGVARVRIGGIAALIDDAAGTLLTPTLAAA
jgi:acetylglutamate kinase